MNNPFHPVPGAVVAPQGFRAAGVFCDIKRLGTGKGSDKGPKRDLALIVSDAPATAAGMFTTNQVFTAPVKVCLEHLRRGRARAIVANSGDANACTGPRGLADAREMAAAARAPAPVPTPGPAQRSDRAAQAGAERHRPRHPRSALRTTVSTTASTPSKFFASPLHLPTRIREYPRCASDPT